MAKNLIVGWDGAPYELIEDYISKGYLPNLKKIRNGGSYGSLKTIIPTISSCAWTTAMTGMNPGKHGILISTGMILLDKTILETNRWNVCKR